MTKELVMKDYTIGGEYKLRLSSKKLKSGKCQVKFHAALKTKKKLYGYVLTDARETLKDVVEKIVDRLDQVRAKDNIHHINLYSIGKTVNDTNFIMFDA